MSAAEAEVASATATAKRPKTEYEKVTMTDSRVVEFPKNRKLQKESLIPGENDYSGPLAVRLDYSNGETRLFQIPGAEIVIQMMEEMELTDVEKARVKFLFKASAHGIEQKLGDEMAYQPKKDGSEPEPTLEDKIEWVDELAGRLSGLEWNVAREGGGGGLAGASTLIQALAELSGKTKEEMRDFLKTAGKDADGKPAPLSREERAAIRRVPAIKAKIEEIEAAQAKAKGVDVTGALGTLGIGAA
jgi:hypothetical protein